MSVPKLIREFDGREAVPIDVNDVVEEIKARGIKDEIYFWSVEINDAKLRGQLVEIEMWDWPNPQAEKKTVYVADIYYAKTLTTDWSRLVTCKESVHLLDPPECRAATDAEVTKLFDRMALRPELQDPIKDGNATTTDRVAIFQAVALLFPFATRQLLLPKLQAGKLTIRDIQRMVDIPMRYVSFVMSDRWEAVHDVLVADPPAAAK